MIRGKEEGKKDIALRPSRPSGIQTTNGLVPKERQGLGESLETLDEINRRKEKGPGLRSTPLQLSRGCERGLLSPVGHP